MIYIIQKLQGILSYEGCTNFQFCGDGIGKIGTSGFLLGFFGGNLSVLDTGMTIAKSHSGEFHPHHLLYHDRDARELYIALYLTFVWRGTAALYYSFITVYVDTLVFVHGFSLLVPLFRIFLNSCIPAIAAHLRM